MTEVVLAVALIFAVLALVAVTRILNESHRQAQAAWVEERRELLNRIQRPDILPTRPAENFAVPDREPDEWNKVGTIELDMNGTGDDGAG